MGAAVGIMQAGVQQQAANQDFEAKSQQWRQNVTDAWASAADQQKQIVLRQLQDQQAMQQKIKLSQIDEAQKRSLVNVSAAYGGVSGISVQNIADEVSRQAANNRTTDRTNYLYQVEQGEAQKQGTIDQAVGRADSLPFPQAPNPATFEVAALSSGVKLFSSLGGM